MRIVNPSFGLEPNEENLSGLVAKGATDWARDPIAIMSNSKPNAREVLEGIRAQLGAFRSVDNINFFSKGFSSKPAPDALYDEIASKYKGAIVALAD